VAFFKNAFEANGWKSARDTPLTKRITITDYPGEGAAVIPPPPPPVATRDILDRLSTYPHVGDCTDGGAY
jgi:hypothetical protein